MNKLPAKTTIVCVIVSEKLSATVRIIHLDFGRFFFGSEEQHYFDISGLWNKDFNSTAHVGRYVMF